MQVIRRAIIFSLSMIAAEVVAQSRAPVHPGLVRLAYRPAFTGAFNHLTHLGPAPTLGNAIAIAKQLAGEFIPFDGAHLSFVEVDTAILWLVLPAGSVTDIALPNGASVSSWRFANGEAGVQGISYQLSVQNSANIWWGGISTTGARSTFRNSELLAMGLIEDTLAVWNTRGISAGVYGLQSALYHNQGDPIQLESSLRLASPTAVSTRNASAPSSVTFTGYPNPLPRAAPNQGMRIQFFLPRFEKLAAHSNKPSKGPS